MISPQEEGSEKQILSLKCATEQEMTMAVSSKEEAYVLMTSRYLLDSFNTTLGRNRVSISNLLLPVSLAFGLNQ